MAAKTGTKKKTITDFNRNQIGSIDISDLQYVEKLSESERKGYIQQAELIWNNPVFHNEIKIMIQAQLEFIGMKANDMNQILTARGTINGIDLFRERFVVYHNEHLKAIQPPEKFDKHKMMPED